jgi:DMSO/TMAO reductase YedYZ molybdopterin-dependent catalytic subunit
MTRSRHHQHSMSRRQLLLLPSTCSMLGQEPTSFPPQNQSFSLQRIEGALTSPSLFFVRDHFPEPVLSLSTWRLKIEGRVTRPLELSLADILESPTMEIEAVLECAGNAAGGSAASNAIWEGVSLAQLLEQAGVAPDAAFVLLEGADTGRLMQGSPQLPYCQLVPVVKCLRRESLLAFKLNGAFLPRKNGFPLRALFPGWYGMDSVKWLQRIMVLGPSDQASDFLSSGMNQSYNRIVRRLAEEPKVTRLTEIQVKSVIAWPPDNAKLSVGRHLVRGFAWTGSGMVRGVAFSSNSGRNWTPAQLESHPKPVSWVCWTYMWSAARGDHVIMSRAIDDAGHEQPLERDPSRQDGYELNFCAPIRCAVR